MDQTISIHSIKIPITQKQSNHQQTRISPAVESDLTELSWLTNNIHFLPNPIIAEKLPIQRPIKHRQQNKQPSSISLSSSSSSSTFTSSLSSSPTSSPSSQFISLPVSPASSTSSSSPSPKSSKTNSKIISTHQLLQQQKQQPQQPQQQQQTQQPINTVNYKNESGLNKPQLTLSCLIFMSLEESKEKCLPVREIYEWIEEHFPYYKSVSNGGWKSSIRHNLSFSKCFKKMDRAEWAYHLNQQQVMPKSKPFSSLAVNSEIGINGRKRRAPNATGTCWMVSPDCRPYLIQVLRKSSFWFHNSRYYSNLREALVEDCDTPSASATYIQSPGRYDETENTNTIENLSKKFKIESAKDAVSDDSEESEEEKQNSLIKFVQLQQEELCKKNKDFGANEGSVNSTPGNTLDLSGSSNSLLTAFSRLSSKISVNSSNELEKSLNSDLEMEVASTLVGMKFFKRT